VKQGHPQHNWSGGVTVFFSLIYITNTIRKNTIYENKPWSGLTRRQFSSNISRHCQHQDRRSMPLIRAYLSIQLLVMKKNQVKVADQGGGDRADAALSFA